jgi:hypothetical protein
MSPENWDFRSQDQIFRETSDKMQSTWLQLAKLILLLLVIVNLCVL